jgi:RHS repeat-associated protein
LGKDVLGSVRSRSNEDGQLEDRYEYDAFGKPYKGDLNSGVNLGYTGKPYDTTTGMYNYGYRDYKPEVARFTTIDPIRDGANWFAYVNNDPVNWIDPYGEFPAPLVGAAIGFISSAVVEVGSRVLSGQSFTEAVSNTVRDPVSMANIASSTVMGALTGGVSSLATKGVTQAGTVAGRNIAVNIAGGAVDSAIKNVAANAITGQPQNITGTLKEAAKGAGLALATSGLTQGAIARGSMTTATTLTNAYGVSAGTELKSPAWSGVAGIIGENVLPTVIDTFITATERGGKNH